MNTHTLLQVPTKADILDLAVCIQCKWILAMTLTLTLNVTEEVGGPINK